MPTIEELQAELTKLRTSHSEVLEKNRERKAKITELEASVTDLQGKLATTETALHDATVGAPLRQLAHTVSPVPDLFLTQFAKQYNVEQIDGKLTVLDAAKGEPVLSEGKPLEFTATAIGKMVTDGDSDFARTMQHITFSTLAGGTGSTGSKSVSPVQAHFSGRGKKEEPKVNLQQFGLRTSKN